MAINDILSVYRQSLQGERQTRLAELQLSMQALQFEAAQQFREEGRQREDALTTLQYATSATQQAMSVDASNIYGKIYNMTDTKGNAIILRDSEGKLKKPSKSLNNLVKMGFGEQDATDIYNVVQMYQTAQNNPKSDAMARSAELAAVGLGRRLKRDYDEYKRGGYTKDSRSNFLTAMKNSNVLFRGDDSFRKDLSVDAFIGAAEAVDAMTNIERERLEIGQGDYTIDSPISATGIGKDADDAFFEGLVGEGGQFIMNERTEEDPLAVDITSTDFLDTSILQSQVNLEDTRSKKSDIQTSLSALENTKKNIAFAKKQGIMSGTDAVSQLKELNQNIKNSKAELDSLQTLELEQKGVVRATKDERAKRRFDAQYEIANRGVTRF